MSVSDLQALYRDQVLKHAKDPYNFGKLEADAVCADGNNPLCGDKLRVCVQQSNGALDDIRFEGSGCAISMASASMMTELLKGLDTESSRKLIGAVIDMLKSNIDTEIPESLSDTPIAALGAARQYPSRIKCATLAWRAIEAVLDGQQQTTTE
ncbi:MAG: Fe-S cluster assembly sulfur transfer protein SufU [Pseudomonadota bacterium]